MKPKEFLLRCQVTGTFGTLLAPDPAGAQMTFTAPKGCPVDLISMPVLPIDLGDRVAFSHESRRFFITRTGADLWIVGQHGSGYTLAVLQRLELMHFRLHGPGIDLTSESWLLLLARLGWHAMRTGRPLNPPSRPGFADREAGGS
ncbi:hypothetical protein N1028_02050 [Herbiconiux sp. CPCC 203407]|uniref:Uncharacterized protein n=1 Tax=Herbiconiux oxytropis TaxID=2970915 RepID=A0AA42BSC5_9MICO|nr:hypothetical protein [Herbiconiux oxytropis]MCS5721020.1 hypothetical protein [Herbiconiux oxytropis]MCS5724672.1 hypothetical protein [Herbiconiux oxytropis]